MSNLTISKMNYLVSVPLLVMSYHVFEFYATEPLVVRIALALSFDLLVVAVFYLLKDPYIKSNKQARQMTWIALYSLIGFQLYVNIWAYWDLSFLRAIVSGSIFPISVGLISYIAMMREEKREKVVEKKQVKQQVQKKLATAESPADLNWSGKLATKEAVRDAFDKGLTVEAFSGSRNLKSVKRWMKKLGQGEEI